MDDISLMLDEAAAAHPGLPRFLYGHSLGGALVLNHALRRRPDIAGAIVTGPGLRPARPQPPLKLILGRALVRSVPALPLDNGLDRTGISRDPAVCAAYRDDPLVHGRVSARFGLDILTSGEWALAHAAEFAYPLLLVQGSDDRIVSPDATREFAEAAGPGVTFQVWDGLYHECHNEPERADVLEAMVAWLKEHSLPAGPDPLEGATAWPRAS
jgi:alpha-beta hydrolase superfamily lysophospholipase